ncbi:Putative zinc- or iron-chelating domain protein [uncultured archaeon]|nr:Putative zinc- or iron-chelating domain protein [uncultured archaeon]
MKYCVIMDIRINYLKKALDEARNIDEIKLADRIKTIGFKCRRCAECCKSEKGDNTVMVSPPEIRRICERTGRKQEDFTVPMPSEDRDMAGNVHTFEWVLKKGGDCIFLKDGLCEIYECRPYICRTYPFYLADGHLHVSECAGTGGAINNEDSLKIAALLKERYIAEINESISLFGKFRGFRPGGKGNTCVHDSEGEHWVDSEIYNL